MLPAFSTQRKENQPERRTSNLSIICLVDRIYLNHILHESEYQKISERIKHIKLHFKRPQVLSNSMILLNSGSNKYYLE